MVGTLLDIPPGWVTPGPRSPVWRSRTLNVDLKVDDDIVLCRAVGLALRHHYPDSPIAYKFFRFSACQEVFMPTMNDNQTKAWAPELRECAAPAAVAVSVDPSPSPSERAIALSVPVIITVVATPAQDILQVTFDSTTVKTPRASWFLRHIHQALRVLLLGGSVDPKRTFQTSLEDTLLGNVDGPSRYQVFVPPSIASHRRLQDIFHERTAHDPLRPAISLCRFDGNADLDSSVTYLDTFSRATRLAEKLSYMGVGKGDSVVVLLEDLPRLAVAMLATLLRDAALVVLDSDTYQRSDFTCPEIPNCRAVVCNTTCLSTIRHGQPVEIDIDGDGYKLLPIAPDSNSSKDRRDLLASHDHDQQSPIACYIPESDDTNQTHWKAVTHEDVIAVLLHRDIQFFLVGATRFLALSLPTDESLCLAMWLVFTRFGTLFYMPKEEEEWCTGASLDAIGCTHLGLPPTRLDFLEKLFNSAGRADNACAVQVPQDLRGLILSRPPSDDAVIPEGLEVILSNYIVPPPPQPEPPQVIFSHPDLTQDITPERVLELLPHGQVISSHSTKVVQIPHDLVVKYGHFVKAAEAQSIMLVSENTSIPVPSVLLVFKKEHDTYIVMRLIRGRTLQDCWEELSNPLREEVLDQFAEYVTELRFLSSEGHTPGPLDGGKCEGQWWTQYGAGPFKTYQDLLSWLNRKLSQSSRTHPLFSDEYPLVFTHQDLCPMNLILDDSNKLWVMDWGMAGWYPAYFEYACVKSPEAYMATRTGWISAALPRLPNYEAEASKLEIMRFALTFLPFC